MLRHFVCLTSVSTIVALTSCRLPIPESTPAAPVAAPVKSTETDEIPMWVIADKLHSGLVFEFSWLVENGFRPPHGFGKPRYVACSWGNRVAYTQREWLTIGQALRALFTPSPSTMELIPFDYEITNVNPHQYIYQGFVSRDRGPEVARFLNACTTRNPRGEANSIGTSSWGKGVLLDSPQRYFLPRVCNVWTLQGLESAGVRVNYLRSLVSRDVVRQIKKQKFALIWDAFPRETEQAGSLKLVPYPQGFPANLHMRGAEYQ